MTSNATTTPREFVSYLRVSTDQQGRSGLGLEAQRHAIGEFLNGDGWCHIAEYVEIESGRKNDRPQLVQALATAKKAHAVLVVGRLDRLSRNAAFLLTLRDAGVEIMAADLPYADKLTVGLMAVVAEHERDLISKRTRDALQAAKARGVKLGSPNPAKGSKIGNATQKARADQFAANGRPVISEIQAAGIATQQGIADALNARGIQTARGGAWHPSSVRNVMGRAG